MSHPRDWIDAPCAIACPRRDASTGSAFIHQFNRAIPIIISLHPNARTTPAVRAEIAASTDSVAVLAARYGVGEGTIRRWKNRCVFTDASHRAHRLQTTLTPAQKGIVVELRKILLLPLDELLAVCREFICSDVLRSGLERCLRRHGVGNLKALLPTTPRPPAKAFKSYEPGYVHVDAKYLPQMQDESRRSYLFVAIDRATRWVFMQITLQERSRCKSVSEGLTQALSAQNHQSAHRQRQGVHGQAVCPAAGAQWAS